MISQDSGSVGALTPCGKPVPFVQASVTGPESLNESNLERVPHVFAQPSLCGSNSASKGVSDPRAQSPASVPDPNFGNWFAGFTDGEGCFIIRVSGKTRKSFGCMFVIGLRADDKPVLEYIQQTTGLGQIYDIPVYESRTRPGTNPQAHWKVQSQKGCLTLMEIFDRCPLRSKKADDYAIWRDALKSWCVKDWPSMSARWDELTQARKYRELVAGDDHVASDGSSTERSPPSLTRCRRDRLLP